MFQLYTVCIHLTKKTAGLSTRLRISFTAPSVALFGVWPSLGLSMRVTRVMEVSVSHVFQSSKMSRCLSHFSDNQMILRIYEGSGNE